MAWPGPWMEACGQPHRSRGGLRGLGLHGLLQAVPLMLIAASTSLLRPGGRPPPFAMAA